MNLIDLERYPLDRLGTAAGDALIARCRADLEANGCCNLPGFLRPEATQDLADEALALEPQAFFKSARRNAYFTPDDPSLPADHPRRRIFHSRIGQIAADQIPAEAGVMRLYRWDPLTEFMRQALGMPTLYRMADPYQSLNFTYLPPGVDQPWHFDDGDFVITLLLQEPEAGGDFVFVPHVRDDGDECYEDVRLALDGRHPGLVTPPRGPGTLTLFRGRHAIHRVTQVGGTRMRISAILSYDRRPDCVADPAVNAFTYGPRVARLLGVEPVRP